VKRPARHTGTHRARRSPCVALAIAALGSLLSGSPAIGPLEAQSATASRIDTLIIERHDLFSEEQAEGNAFARLSNDLHVLTRPFVIRRELLFGAGDPVDSLLLAESERNLRATGLFRSVRIDTLRVDGRLAARVTTRDAWTLLPRATLNVSSEGDLTGSFGLTETNLGGTGNRLQVWYVREADRDGAILSTVLPRVGSRDLEISASYATLSDVKSAGWTVARPFRSFSSKWSVFYGGSVFDGRIPQYRTPSAAVRDTMEWQRRSFRNRLFATWAPIASPERYVRVGVMAEVRREEYLRFPPEAVDRDSVFSLVPDSIYGLASVFAEYRRSRFERLGRFNGFTEEDQDLSDLVYVSVNLAPGALGYRRTGIGGRIVLRSGTRLGPALLKGIVDGDALFTSAGLDSGRVVATGTVAIRVAERHATFAQVSGGMIESGAPGSEFDLGFEILPRMWGPHAFVGTRSVRFTLEHRFFAFDSILEIVGLGLAGFVDYGGAWYASDDPRMGGNAGLSIFFGSPMSSLAQVNHISMGYRFGGDLGESGSRRWSFSAGSGIIF